MLCEGEGGRLSHTYYTQTQCLLVTLSLEYGHSNSPSIYSPIHTKQYVGITAIEDRLQDQVPETIANLIEGGVVVSMITGDKEETAVNIATSCNLIQQGMELVVVTKCGNREQLLSAFRQGEDRLADLFRRAVDKTLSKANACFVVDGPSLAFLDGDEDELGLLSLMSRCRSVVVCRSSPSQKAQIVTIVKRNLKPEPVTLGIGDGANDVSMIQAADVGVGIIGKEGRQAANNADFAIGQFKFLGPLMLVHGRANYRRQANVFLYCTHKNMVSSSRLRGSCMTIPPSPPIPHLS